MVGLGCGCGRFSLGSSPCGVGVSTGVIDGVGDTDGVAAGVAGGVAVADGETVGVIVGCGEPGSVTPPHALA